MMRDRFGLDIGSTMLVGRTVKPAEVPPQFAAPGGADADPPEDARRRHHQVGVERPRLDAVERLLREVRRPHAAASSTCSSTCAAARRRSPKFTERVDRILGHPVNVEDTADLYGIRKALNVTDFERDGLLLFAFAALVGGGVLVGQALVRAVSASAADLPTWRAIGADRRAGDARAGAARASSRVGVGAADHRRRRGRAVVALPARHRARLRPRPRDPRRLARARHRRGGRARRGSSRSRRSPRGGGSTSRAARRPTLAASIACVAPHEPRPGAR